jgi:hypothetical protein
MIAAGMAASRLSSTRGRGGGGGDHEPPQKKGHDWGWWFLVIMGLAVAIMFVLVLLRIVFTKEGVSYVVDGALVEYTVKRSGKTDKVFVNILQSDGKIRQYKTDYKPEQCNYHVLGIGIQTIVTPYYDPIFNETTYRSQLAVDPCA